MIDCHGGGGVKEASNHVQSRSCKPRCRGLAVDARCHVIEELPNECAASLVRALQTCSEKKIVEDLHKGYYKTATVQF